MDEITGFRQPRSRVELDEKGQLRVSKSKVRRPTQKMRVIIKAMDAHLADSQARTLVQAARDTGAVVAGPIPFPKKVTRFELQPQAAGAPPVIFEDVVVHKRLIDIHGASDNTVNVLTKLNLSGAIAIRIHLL